MNNLWDYFTGRNQVKAGNSQPSWTEEEWLNQLDPERLPQHIAIVMDGNGRWAKAHGLPRQLGHRNGAEALRRVLKTAQKIPIHTITVYAFSTENWKRSNEEVSFLMNLLVEYLRRETEELHSSGVRVRLLGDRQGLPTSVQQEFDRMEALTVHNVKMNLNVAVNYGSRREIIQAAQHLAAQAKAGEIEPADIDETLFSQSLYTADQPDPDLLIRPSGELRISNYLLWQLAYAEFYYTPVLWPDFNGKELCRAIYDFQQRDRRFGGRNGK